MGAFNHRHHEHAHADSQTNLEQDGNVPAIKKGYGHQHGTDPEKHEKKKLKLSYGNIKVQCLHECQFVGFIAFVEFIEFVVLLLGCDVVVLGLKKAVGYLLECCCPLIDLSHLRTLIL